MSMRWKGAIALCVLSALCPALLHAAADAVYLNGQVWTGGGINDLAEAVAVKGNRIVAVGTTQRIKRLIAVGTRVVDLRGAFVSPGFIDNHVHFLEGGLALGHTDLRRAGTPQAFTSLIAKAAAQAQPGEWILHGNWDHESWGGELPTREWIDKDTATTPVFVTRLDGHMALANSLALELAGIDANTPDPPGGTIVRDSRGQPTGILKDRAQELVTAAIPPESDAQLDRAMQLATDHALSAGLTQVHDMAFDTWRSFDTYQRANARGQVRMRIYSFVPLQDWKRLADFISVNGRSRGLLRWGGVKGYVDGSLGSMTAWFYEPYLGEAHRHGLMRTQPDELRAMVQGADGAGLQVVVHAIGDRANDWLLDTYRDVAARHAPRDRRFRIEHAQHLAASALPRFEGQHVIASMQPYHAIDDGRWADKRIGPEQIKGTYAFHSLLNAQATLAFGSDWPVAPIDPLLGIYAAVTRRTIDGANPDGWRPEQKVTVEQAIRAYTQATAYAGFQEQQLGRLAPGRLADFVVLSDNLFRLDPVKIKDVRVLRTIVDGREAYTRSAE